MVNVPTFMVTVETKNYPVTTIRPSLQRYARIRKKLNASEIANCLAAYAVVTLEKNDGTKIRLTRENFKSVLYDYTNQLKATDFNKKVAAEAKKNDERIQNVIDNPPNVEEETPAPEEPVTTTSFMTNAELSGTTVNEFNEKIAEGITEPEDVLDEEPGEQAFEHDQIDPEMSGEFDDSEYYES